jgi:hypothetical protein
MNTQKCETVIVTLAAMLLATIGTAENSAKILSPLPYQVSQRDTTTVSADSAGAGRVLLRWSQSAPVYAHEWRTVAMQGAFGKGTSWASVKPTVSGDVCSASVTIPAGGWYRLEVRRAGDAKEAATVEPIGVGEVFLITGQSYAANCNEERLKVSEPQRRVACLDPKTGAWRIADDPQPGASEYKGGGTIWPAFGDGLAAALELPVGFANVAWQGASSRQWMPGGNLHKSMVAAASGLGRCRAVLWQQGESDVIAGIPAETYVANVTAIRAALAKETGLDVVWLPAKSTIHPTVYNKPKQEAVIREAVDTLWKTPGFAPGPDTDALDGKHRQMGGCSHFSAIGQRRAAELWVDAVTNLIAPANVRTNQREVMLP